MYWINVKKIIKNLLYHFRRKNKVLPNSILIIPGSWHSFEGTEFPSKYNYVYSEIELIKSSDLSNIIACVGNVDKSYLKKLPNLEWLQLSSHGYNHYDDKDLYAAKSVLLSRVKGVFSEPIAQFCISSFYYFKSYPLRLLNKKNPPPRYGAYGIIDNVTITIIGLGDIGAVLAQKCKQMGWRVFGVKRNMPLDIPSYVDRLFRFELIEEALAVSDFVVSVLPETPETIGLYDISFFKKMKRTAIFCNVGRGSAVVDDDIELAVSSNLISGAILDAANRCSYKHPNILYTGHTSSISDTNDTKFNQYFRSQLTLFLTGKNPLNGIVL